MNITKKGWLLTIMTNSTKLLISVSKGNSKTGAIAAFNLPPIKSCLNSSTCASFKDAAGKEHKCYATLPYNRYKATKAAWDRNFEIAQNDLPELEAQLVKFFKSYNGQLFRLHVSGDFFSKEYLGMWVRVTKRFPDVKFLAYTKVYGFFKGLELPKNFSVLLSFMPSIPVPQATKFAEQIGLQIAHVTDERPVGFVTCPEQTTDRKVNCVECKLCWNISSLKRPINIHFIPH